MQTKREASAPFQNPRQNVLFKSFHGARVPSIKESPIKKMKGSIQNQPQVSPRAKKEINVNLMSHMSQNADFNNLRGVDTRGKHNSSALQQDSAMQQSENPMKQRYNMKQSSASPQKPTVQPSSDSLEKLNDIVNLSDELYKMHNLKAKRDQMMAKTQIMMGESQINSKSHQWSDTAQILEQITQSQYTMGRSDAKQQKELQMKIMKNHFSLVSQNDDVAALSNKIHHKKASFVQGALKNYEFKNFKHKDSFLRGGSQIEQKQERRSSLITNGFNLRNQKHPATDFQGNQRSKTPFIDSKNSPRRQNARLFPPATRHHARERAGLNFSFKNSQDWSNLNQDLKSEAINLSHTSKSRPQTKDRQSNKRSPNLQFLNMKHPTKLKKQNMNCSTSPMSPQRSTTVQGFSRLSESMAHENKVKIQDENNDYQNQNNIFNQLGSRLQSERSNQQHTKVVQSRLSSERYGTTFPDFNAKNTQNILHAKMLAQKIQNLQEGNTLQNCTQEESANIMNNVINPKDTRFFGNRSPSPLNKTHQISITTSNCNIPNQYSEELVFVQGDRLKQIKMNQSNDYKVDDKLNDKFPKNLMKSKMLNINELTSKTMSNSQSGDHANKFIQTKTIDKSDVTSQNTQIHSQMVNKNIMVVNSNVISEKLQMQAPNQMEQYPQVGKIGGVNVQLKPISYTIREYEQEIQKLTGVKRKAMRPVEKRMLATQVFAIQAYDQINQEKQEQVVNQAKEQRAVSQGKLLQSSQNENDSGSKLKKLKITLPLNQDGNQPLSPAESMLDDQNAIQDYGPRLAGGQLNSPTQKKSFYKQLVEAYNKKAGKKSKSYQGGNGVGIYNKIQTLSKKHDFDKMDAWTAAQILTEFPELAQELILPVEPLKVEEQLQCAPKELNLQTVKSPINSQKKSNNNPTLTEDRDQENTLSSERKNYIRKTKLHSKNSQEKLSIHDSARLSGVGETKNNNVDTREDLHIEAVQQELRKITFKIDKEITNDRDKMLSQLEQLLPDKNLSQISDRQLRQVLQELITQSTDRKQTQITSGRQNKDKKESQFFTQRRQTQGSVKTSTFLPLKDRQAKQQFRIFVQNEKDQVVEPIVTTVFEPIKQKQMFMDKIEQPQEQAQDCQIKDQGNQHSSQVVSSVVDSAGFSGLSHNGKLPLTSQYLIASRQSKTSDIRTSSLRFPPKRASKSSYKHQRNISQLNHHQSQLQQSGFVQMSPKELTKSSDRRLEIKNENIKSSQGKIQDPNSRNIYFIDKRSTPIEERIARVQSRENSLDQVNGVEISKIAIVAETSDHVSMSRPSTILGFDKGPVGSGGLMSFMNQSPGQQSEIRRFSQDFQQPLSIPKQRIMENLELVGSKQQLATRTPVSQQESRQPQGFNGSLRANGQILTLENINDYSVNQNILTGQIQESGSTSVEVSAAFAQKVSKVSQVTHSLHPITVRQGQPSNDSSNISKIIPNQMTQFADEKIQQFSVRTKETERFYIQSQPSNTIKSDNVNPMMQIMNTNLQQVQQFQGNHGRIITSRVHERIDTDQNIQGSSKLHDVMSDQKSNDLNSDLFSPIQQVQKRETNPLSLKSPQQMQEQYLNLAIDSKQTDDKTSGERTTINHQVRSNDNSCIPSRVEDHQTQIINVNKIMIIDSKGNSSKNTARSTVARQKQAQDEKILWQQADGNILEFLDQQLKPAKPNNNCFPQSQSRYRGNSLTGNVKIRKKSQSPPQTHQQYGTQSPKAYQAKASEKPVFQAGEYIKNLKRSVEKIEKKGNSKNNLDQLVAQINESFQQTQQQPNLSQTKVSQKFQRNQFGLNGQFKKSMSPKNTSTHLHATYEMTSLGRNQMAVQNVAQNMWMHNQRQNQRQQPDLPQVIGTTFMSKNTQKQLQQENNANFSLLNPPTLEGQEDLVVKNSSVRSIDDGIEIIKAINEVSEADESHQNTVKRKQDGPNRDETNITPTTDVLLDKIMAHAAQEMVEVDQTMSKPIMDINTPYIQNRKEDQFPNTQSSACSISEMSPQRLLMSKEISPESFAENMQSNIELQKQIQIKDQN